MITRLLDFKKKNCWQDGESDEEYGEARKDKNEENVSELFEGTMRPYQIEGIFIFTYLLYIYFIFTTLKNNR